MYKLSWLNLFISFLTLWEYVQVAQICFTILIQKIYWRPNISKRKEEKTEKGLKLSSFIRADSIFICQLFTYLIDDL